MTKQMVSKSGVKGKNKHGKPTTAAKLAKKRAQKRNDEAWLFLNYDKPKRDNSRKDDDAWMYERVGQLDSATTSKPQ